MLMTHDSPSSDDAQRARFSSVAPVLALPVLAGFLFVGVALQISHKGAGLWLSELLVFLGVPWVALRMLGFSPARAVGLVPFDPKELGAGFALGAVNFIAWVLPIQALAQLVLPREVLEQADLSELFRQSSPLELALVISSVVIAAPICEEVFFRGSLQQGLEGRYAAPRAVVVSALIFTVFHFDLAGLVARFELGVLFGLLAWRTRSLWAGIGAHAANNAVSVLAFFASGGPEMGEANVPWWLPVSCFVVGNAVLIVLARWLSRSALPSRVMPALEALPAGRWIRVTAPFWVVSAVAVALVGVFDWRGVRLSWFDVANPVASKEDRHALRPLRTHARNGEVPLETYFEARRAKKLAK